MSKSLIPFGLAASLVLLLACASWGQDSPPPPSTQPSQPPAGTNRGNTTPQPNRTQPNRDIQRPLYIEGQVINENGKVPEGLVSVRLNCGMRAMQTIKTDIQGYFRFTLGLGAQSNADFSAVDEAATPSTMTGMNDSGGFGGFGGFGASSGSLTGCDIRISVPGYVPLSLPITDPGSLGVVDVGILQLRRIGTAPTGSVSATSLMVPNNARKEFEQGVKDLHNNRLPQATQHLERAVDAYDKYATAWTELGRAYAASHETAKARQAWEKAIAADPKYVVPYVHLGAAQLEDQDYEAAIESIGHALEVDPTIAVGVGGYIQGFANFRLDRLEAAQENLLQAEKGPHSNTPQLHVLLADIYLRKQDSSNAAAHMRAYIKEAPQGHFAEDLRKRLAEIDQAETSNGADGSAAPPVIAP